MENKLFITESGFSLISPQTSVRFILFSERRKSNDASLNSLRYILQFNKDPGGQCVKLACSRRKRVYVGVIEPFNSPLSRFNFGSSCYPMAAVKTFRTQVAGHAFTTQSRRPMFLKMSTWGDDQTDWL